VFTGLVERTGKIVNKISESGFIKLNVHVGDDFIVAIGDSVAINGCCLTVARIESRDLLWFDINHETLAKTSLGGLSLHSIVNLERAMQLGDRLGGHLVTGHVDGLGRIETFTQVAGGHDLKISIASELAQQVVLKGSLTIDGVSLTVNSVEDFEDRSSVSFTLIPVTLQKTAFVEAKAGQHVNIETDIIAKHVERLLKFKK
jgi:riboflavin synthase